MHKLINHIRSAAALAAMIVTLTVSGFAGGYTTQEPSTRALAVGKPGAGSGGTATTSQYFQTELSFTLNQGIVGLGTFTVPAGKVLVIEYVSASGVVPAGESIIYTVSTGAVQHFIPAVQQALEGYQTVFVAGQQTRLYAQPDTTVTLGATRTGFGGTASATMSVSGYLADAQ